MSKLAAKDSHERKPFKPQIYKSRGQNRAYGQGGYQTRSDNGNRGHITSNNSRLNYRSNNFRGTVRGYGRQNNRENYRNDRYSSNNRDRSRNNRERGKELLQGIMVITEIEAQATIDLGQCLELVQIGIE